MKFVKIFLTFFIFTVLTSATGYGWTFYRTSVELVSVSTLGGYPNGDCSNAAISLDGRFVAFDSEANNLVDGVNLPTAPGGETLRQIYVRDLKRGKTELVSVSSSGEPANAPCYDPSISPDGSYVTFYTQAKNLNPNLYQHEPPFHVYLRDRTFNATVLISQTSGWYRFSQSSKNATIRADGRSVFFSSKKFSELGPYRLFRRYLPDGTTTEFDAGTGREVAATHPSTSGPAVWWAFESTSPIPWTDADGTVRDPLPFIGSFSRVYLYHSGTNAVYPASTRHGNGGGVWPTSNSSNPSVNVAGGRVAFESDASDLLGSGNDTNNKSDIFVFRQRDYVRGRRTPTRISISSDGTEANGHSRNPSMSKGYVAFQSDASNLVEDDSNERTDIFRHDIKSGKTIIISRGGRHGEVESNRNSFDASIDESGSRIAFTSKASNLDPTINDTPNNRNKIYVWRERFTLIPVRGIRFP